MDNFILLENAEKTFSAGSSVIRAVDGMSFSICTGEFVVIVGPSGAGKTTLLNLLGGMDSLSCGSIVVDGKDLSRFNAKQLTLYRRFDVGFVFQFYNLMPNLTALENIELATEICPKALVPREVLNMVGLSERGGNFPSQLSGGEQQRVAIARAVAKNPKMLLCDEPTGALDYVTGKKILRLLYDICRSENKTVIIVTHNSALKDMADKVIFVKNGRAEKVVINPEPKNIEEIEW